MSTSNNNSARRSCFLMILISTLLLLIGGSIVGALMYWIYKHLGLIWTIMTGILVVPILFFFNRKLQKRLSPNIHIKVYVEVNPKYKTTLKEFTKTLSKQQKNEKVNENLKVIRHKLNNLIESGTQTKLHLLTYDNNYFDPNLSIELDNYINIAARNNDLICVEALKNLI